MAKCQRAWAQRHARHLLQLWLEDTPTHEEESPVASLSLVRNADQTYTLKVGRHVEHCSGDKTPDVAVILAQLDGTFIDPYTLDLICDRLPDELLLNVARSIVRSLELLDSMSPDEKLRRHAEIITAELVKARGYL
jgi:hypothetical protein